MVLTVYLTGDAAQFFLFSETVSGGIEDWASRLQKIKNALQELELGKPAEKSKTPEKDQINFTDPPLFSRLNVERPSPFGAANDSVFDFERGRIFGDVRRLNRIAGTGAYGDGFSPDIDLRETFWRVNDRQPRLAADLFDHPDDKPNTGAENKGARQPSANVAKTSEPFQLAVDH